MRRLTRQAPLQRTASFLRASPSEQLDLRSAAEEFEKEIAAFTLWRKEQGGAYRPEEQKAGFSNEHLPEWEEIARWWQESPHPPDAVISFFDNYVHDSRAAFKIAGSREPFMGGKAGYLRFRKVYGGEDAVLLSSRSIPDSAVKINNEKDTATG